MTRAPRTVCIVTGTRAEFGLLRPVIDAVRTHKRLKLQLVAAGAHFLPPARTIREVRAAYKVAAEVRMQRTGATGRQADAEALGRGVSGFARAFAKLKPDWVVVLGDRIEAFAAASAASIAGIAVCHIHGGDRAEGIADEAMRHAITKLSHLHCAATEMSAQRIVKMGERREHVHVTGSPAVDGLDRISPMCDAAARKWGDPRGVVILHPWGAPARLTRSVVESLAMMVLLMYADDDGSHVLWLSPNQDPGRDDILRPLARTGLLDVRRNTHVPRDELIALFKRLAARGKECAIIGNSSAGLIEAAAIGLPAVNIGPRQEGRERAGNVLDVSLTGSEDQCDANLARAFDRLRRFRAKPSTIYGDGRSGPRIAALLASVDPHAPALLRKHNTY